MCSRTTLLIPLLALVATLAACSKTDNKNEAASTTTTTAGSGSAANAAGSAGSAGAAGSADTGSAGSAAVGSADAGSADAGSADAGSAGSGSGSGDAGSAAAGSAAGVPFDKLSHDDKVKFMKQKVMPVMKAHFQKFDPKEFKNFTCKTCHGKDPQKAKYEMPNKELSKLDFEALKRGEEKEEAEFMTKIVKPEMAKLLGEPEYSDANPDGFGCLNCHTAKK